MSVTINKWEEVLLEVINQNTIEVRYSDSLIAGVGIYKDEN